MKTPKEQPIGFALRTVHNQIRRSLDTRFAETGLDKLSGIQGPILGFVEEHSRSGDVFQKDIEKQFNIRRSTATTTLQSMEQKGLLVREAVAGDGRMKRIVLTPKAIKLHTIVKQEIDSFHEQMEEGITEEEKQAFLAVLNKILANLQQET